MHGSISRGKVFISYSHKDSEWLEQLTRHLRPLERELSIDLWDDRRISPGTNWKTEIQRAIVSARVAVLLISPDFLASDFIAADELPPLLQAARGRGTLILPLILSPSRFTRDPNLSSFQAVNNPSEPLIGMDRRKQEETLDRLAQTIESTLRNYEAVFQERASELYISTPKTEEGLRELADRYYRHLANECRHLPLGTIAAEHVSKREEHRISLASLFVRLDVHSAAREESDSSDREWALRLAIGDEGERTPFLEAISNPDQRFHVLLGEGGSGKTSTINYLAFQMATQESSLPEPLTGLWPIHLVLREVAAKHISESTRGSARVLWSALLEEIIHHIGEFSAGELLGYLQRHMLREGALVLLDGLDEVPEANHRREILLNAIRDLTNVLDHPRTRFIVTARPYAYVDPQWQLTGFTSWTLSPFNEIQQRDFIQRWHRAVRPSFGWSEDTAETKSERLQFALRTQPLRELASRPLFLTLMAALHSNRGQLPEDRAELYEETVRLMLSRWQRAREVRGPNGDMILEPGITEALDVGETKIRSALELLAYGVQEKQRLRPDAQEGPADISRGEVLEAFEPLFDSIKFQTLLSYLENRAGLLIERKSGVFAFPHRSFQEYLAACHFVDEVDFPEGLVRRVNDDYGWWREIFLLAVGKARRGSLAIAMSLVSELLPYRVDEVSEPVERDWRNALLAGEALRDLHIVENQKCQSRREALLRQTRKWLAELLRREELTSLERLKAGDVLGELGDPRRGVGVIEHAGVPMPDIDWVVIPAGEFIMGSSGGDRMSQANERPQHRVCLPVYCISRYPITNEQFKIFIDSGGYEEKRYWNTVGWDWVRGGEADFGPVGDERLMQRYTKWMSRRPRIKRSPDWWEDPSWRGPTRPVIGVNWYEAMAYAKWLDEVYAENPPEFIAAFLGEGCAARVRLPTEAEWEKAARGTEASIWPWGNELRKGVANTKEEGLEMTSPVGIFPSGASPFGVLDMAGNIWEWTITRWGYKSFREPDYKYPYDPSDGREDESGKHIRVVRGSSWFGDLPDYARCAYRGWGFTFNASTFSGFRLVIAFRG